MCVVSVQLQKHLHWQSFTETDLQCGCGRAGGGLQDDGGSLLPYIQVLLPFSLPSYPSDLQHFRPASTRRSPQHQDTIVDIQDSRISPTHPHRVPVSPHPACPVWCALWPHRSRCTAALGESFTLWSNKSGKSYTQPRLQHVPSSR